MIGSDDVLACFIAGNAFTVEYSLHISFIKLNNADLFTVTGSV